MKCSHYGKTSKGMLKGVQIAWWKYGSRRSSRYCKQHFDATLIRRFMDFVELSPKQVMYHRQLQGTADIKVLDARLRT